MDPESFGGSMNRIRVNTQFQKICHPVEGRWMKPQEGHRDEYMCRLSAGRVTKRVDKTYTRSLRWLYLSVISWTGNWKGIWNIQPAASCMFLLALCNYLSLSRIASFGFFDHFRVREPLVWVLSGKKNQNPVGPSYFKTFKELAVFMKEPTSNELMVLWLVIWIFFPTFWEPRFYTRSRVLEIWGIVITNLRTTLVTIRVCSCLWWLPNIGILCSSLLPIVSY